VGGGLDGPGADRRGHRRARAERLGARGDGGLALLRPSDEHLWLAWLAGPAPAQAALARAATARAGALGLPRCRALLASDAATERALEAAGYARGLEYYVWERGLE